MERNIGGHLDMAEPTPTSGGGGGGGDASALPLQPDVPVEVSRVFRRGSRRQRGG